MKSLILIFALLAASVSGAEYLLLSTNVAALAYPTPIPVTGQTNSYTARDDGALTNGVPWPLPRFTVHANTNCVRDNTTGLIWAYNANLTGATNWASAISYCNGLNYGGRTDWRLPNERELKSLMTSRYASPALCNTTGTAQWTTGNPFVNVIFYGNYWASTTLNVTTNSAVIVYMDFGSIYRDAKSALYYVWPCCGP